jgi:DDE superfamily endonuclease/Helix-turn-helix of DDE superfamily endonuclease
MISYQELCRRPAAFPSLTGLTRPEFDDLLARFQRAEAALRARSPSTRRDGQPRTHAPGAGHPYARAAADRLLMALLWLRAYPTYEVLGFFFDLHKRNAQLNVRAVLEVLDALDDFPFDRPGPDRKKLRSACEVMAAFPQVRLILDAKEQRVHRPQGEEAQRPYYSGKKKAHTVKTQVVVNPRGQIEAVSASVPGGANHDLTLLRSSGVLERLGAGEAAMMDKGSTGVGKHYPGVAVVLPFKKPRGGELSAEQRSHNREVARHRVVVEHTMAQLNRFTVLRQVFRGKRRERHGKVIRVVAKLVNQRLAVTPLKTYAA